MAVVKLIEYKEAPPEVRAVYDDIMATRRSDWVNNFWKALAHDPPTLRRTWEAVKQVMAPGARRHRAMNIRPSAARGAAGPGARVTTPQRFGRSPGVNLCLVFSNELAALTARSIS